MTTFIVAAISIGVVLWAIGAAHEDGYEEGYRDGQRKGRFDAHQEDFERSMRQLRQNRWRRTGKSDFGPPTINQEETDMATKAELEAELARYKAGVVTAMEKAQEGADRNGWCDTWKSIARDIAQTTGIEEFGAAVEPGYISITIDNIAIGPNSADDANRIMTVVEDRIRAFLRTSAGRHLVVPGLEPRVAADDWGLS